MWNESLYAADFVAGNATAVPIQQLLRNAIAIWVALVPGLSTDIAFTASFEQLTAPQIGHISCDSAVRGCTIRISDEYGRPDVVMLHEVGHAHLFRVYPIKDANFVDDHWASSDLLMSSRIGATPTISAKTVALIANGADTTLCRPDCVCTKFGLYPAAPRVCVTPGTSRSLLPLAIGLLAAVAVLGVLIGVCVAAGRTADSSPSFY